MSYQYTPIQCVYPKCKLQCRNAAEHHCKYRRFHVEGNNNSITIRTSTEKKQNYVDYSVLQALKQNKN